MFITKNLFDNDITAAERLQYALRKLRAHFYICDPSHRLKTHNAHNADDTADNVEL